MATSAGLLMYRFAPGGLEVLLVRPGGPFWAGKDLGAWSIPKGEHGPEDDALETARRELQEETGCAVEGNVVPLGRVKQRGGKVVQAWAAEGDCDPGPLRSNTFFLEWPPRSGRKQEFPEVDRAAWFPMAEARRKILPGQAAFLDRLVAAIQASGGSSG